MKRKLSIVLNLLSLAIILVAMNFFDNLLFFIIAGAVPGTSLSLSPIIMLLIIIALGIIVSLNAGRFVETRHEAQRILPRKRYVRL